MQPIQYISRLQIQKFRNLASIDLVGASKFNIICGLNGSGKTSLLEALHYLAYSKSFRTSTLDALIQHHQTEFFITAWLECLDSPRVLGCHRTAQGEKQFRIDGESSSAADMSQLLPLILMNTQSYRIFHDGPQMRRRYLDWLTFHVEPAYLKTWRLYQRALKQRNEALQLKKSRVEVQIWDEPLVAAAEMLHSYRSRVISEVQADLRLIIRDWFPEFEYHMEYYPGWTAKSIFADELKAHWAADWRYGHTRLGPHRADIRFEIAGHSLQTILSQGQQKLFAYALYLAQGLLLMRTKQVRPMFLIDDLPSELDRQRQQDILRHLEVLATQVWITAIEDDSVIRSLKADTEYMLFHVEQGRVGNKRNAVSLRRATGQEGQAGISGGMNSGARLFG